MATTSVPGSHRDRSASTGSVPGLRPPAGMGVALLLAGAVPLAAESDAEEPLPLEAGGRAGEGSSGGGDLRLQGIGYRWELRAMASCGIQPRERALPPLWWWDADPVPGELPGTETGGG